MRPGSAVVPGEQTMMGFGVAAALGAARAAKNRPVVLVCGDGALTMNISVFATAADHGIGFAAIVFDNNSFGWPRLGRKLVGADDGLTRFDNQLPFVSIVESFGGYASTPDSDEVFGALREARAAVEDGRCGLVLVRVRDDDIPIGVQRIFGVQQKP